MNTKLTADVDLCCNYQDLRNQQSVLDVVHCCMSCYPSQRIHLHSLGTCMCVLIMLCMCLLKIIIVQIWMCKSSIHHITYACMLLPMLCSLPYRMVYAVASIDSVLLYDTQHTAPFAFVSNIHYAAITDMAW